MAQNVHSSSSHHICIPASGKEKRVREGHAFTFMKHFLEVVHYIALPTTSTHILWSELVHMAAVGSRQVGKLGFSPGQSSARLHSSRRILLLRKRENPYRGTVGSGVWLFCYLNNQKSLPGALKIKCDVAVCSQPHSFPGILIMSQDIYERA